MIILHLFNQKNDLIFAIKFKQMNTSFERCENTKVEWLTPPELVKKLGEFDLDPCSLV